MKIQILAGLFATVLISLATITAQGSEKPKDTLSVAVGGEFETLHPLISQQAITKYMLYLAWRPLVVLSPDNEWIPLFIKDLPTTQNKLARKTEKGLDVSLEIIPTANWGDGQPLTCKDLEFAWKVGLNNNVSIGNRESYENITAFQIDSANPKKCVVKFKNQKYDYFANLPDPLPEHLEGPVFEKHKNTAQGYDHNSLYVKNPSLPGLYFGPFQVSEVKLGSHVTFVANPKWQGTKPYFKKVIFKVIPNNATHVANLQAGNIDMISPAGGLGLDQAIAFEKKVKDERLPYSVEFAPGKIYAHIDLNLDHPILKDLRVRKALSHAFNKEEMLQSLMQGRATPAIHFAPKGDPWFTDKVSIYKFSRREAARLLDEAGWKVGKGGIREKDGKRLSLTLMAAAGAKINDTIQTYMQDQYKAVGIELFAKSEPARVYFGDTLKNRKFEMALYSWVSIPEQTPRSTLHSTMIPSKANSLAGQNQPGWKNPEVDKLIDQLETELDANKRKALAHKIMEHYTRDIPVIPIYYRPDTAVIPADMAGYRLSGHLFYESLMAENWRRDSSKKSIPLKQAEQPGN